MRRNKTLYIKENYNEIAVLQRITAITMRYDEQINFRTTSSIKERLKSIADSQGMKVSQLVNEIVAAYLSGESATVTADVTLQKVYEIVVSQEKRLETLEKKSAA